MKIILYKLKINHFKGLKALDVSFTHNTNISGDNATGKTTVMDAFLWLIFGKDSTDRTAFEVKHITQNGNGAPKDVEVEGELLVDDQPVTLKRIFREKWLKKRGSITAEFSGHETILYFNEVPVSLREYQDKIASICGEDTFKMLTNPYYFPSLNWKVQRSILFEIAGGEVPDKQIADGNKKFETLLSGLTGKTLEEYRKQVANQKRRINEELELIPARIDEVQRNLPAEEPWDEILQEITIEERKLVQVEDTITDKSKAYETTYQEKTSLQKKLHEARNKLSTLVAQHEMNINKRIWDADARKGELESRRVRTEQYVSELEQAIASWEQKIATIEKEMKDLRQRFYDTNNQQFSFEPDNAVCPTCKRPVDDMEEKKQKMLEDFNRDKAHRLAKIQSEGKALKEEKDRVEAKVSQQQADLKKAKAELQCVIESIGKMPQASEKRVNHEDIPGYAETKQWIDQLQAEYDKPVTAPDLNDLRYKKSVLVKQLEELNALLSLREQIRKGNNRISELEHQQQKLAQEVARLEKIEFTIQAFERAKVEAIEKKVNSMFEITRWKLFEQQINGAEVPTCKATHKAVPYADLNSAAKANVGLDIINTLSGHYGVTAPIFFDNREGVNHLIDTPSQLINLIVTKDPELVIENLENHGTEKYTPETAQAY
jgi:DNA repair protein SbcC/Rad50